MQVHNYQTSSTILDKNDYYLKADVDKMIREQAMVSVKRIIGSVLPVAETSEDSRRLENLKTHIVIVGHLMDDLLDIARLHDRHESSLKTAAKEAIGYLRDLNYRFSERGELKYD